MKWIIVFIFILRITVPFELWDNASEEEQFVAQQMVGESYHELQPDCKTVFVKVRGHPFTGEPTIIAECMEVRI